MGGGPTQISLALSKDYGKKIWYKSLQFSLLQRNGIGVYKVSADKTTYRGKWEYDMLVGDGEQIFEERNGKMKVERIKDGKFKSDPTGLNSPAPQLPNIKIMTD